MKRPELAVLVLWLVAIVSTVVVIDDTGRFTYLGPVYFVCTLGSLLVVRGSSRRGRG
jgi:hypothetical protein